MSTDKTELVITTYLCPTQPVQLFELLMEALESSFKCHTTLIYESRSPGPFSDRPDPFQNNKTDIAFMTAEAYMKLKESKNPYMELLPVTPVFAHQMNVENKPGYFSDIIIHSDKKAHNVNTLLDLRGCTFAFSNEDSLSSSKIVIKTLQEKGENASFFGSQLRSGSHLASAQMVLTKQADWAAIDSTTLLFTKKYMHNGGKDITTLETLGRLPPYPIVARKNLPDEVKKAVTNTLLHLHENILWKRRVAKFGLIKYVHNSDSEYEDAKIKQLRDIHSSKLHIRYY